MENSNIFNNDDNDEIYTDIFGSKIEKDDSLIVVMKDKFLYILESNVVNSKSRNLLNVYSSMLSTSRFNLSDFEDISKLFGPLLPVKDLVSCCLKSTNIGID